MSIVDFGIVAGGVAAIAALWWYFFGSRKNFADVAPHVHEHVEEKPEKIVLSVSGISCPSCLNNISGVLEAEPGLSNIETNFATEEVSLVYQPERVTLEHIIQRIHVRSNAGKKTPCRVLIVIGKIQLLQVRH